MSLLLCLPAVTFLYYDITHSFGTTRPKQTLLSVSYFGHCFITAIEEVARTMSTLASL